MADVDRTIGIGKTSGDQNLTHASGGQKSSVPGKAGIVAEQRTNREMGEGLNNSGAIYPMLAVAIVAPLLSLKKNTKNFILVILNGFPFLSGCVLLRAFNH